MIRFILENELTELVDLCAKHAEYERSDYEQNSKKINDLKKAIFSKEPKIYCLVAEIDDKIIGYATYMLQYSTWDASDYVYLDCLFLEETARGKNIGQKIMKRVKEEALNLGIHLIQWQTPNFNSGAIAFYKRLGAVSKKKERFFWKL